jgi:hypothetical protein
MPRLLASKFSRERALFRDAKLLLTTDLSNDSVMPKISNHLTIMRSSMIPHRKEFLYGYSGKSIKGRVVFTQSGQPGYSVLVYELGYLSRQHEIDTNRCPLQTSLLTFTAIILFLVLQLVELPQYT